MEITLRSGTRISVPETDLPVSIARGLADDPLECYDIISCARAIKDYCWNEESCDRCPFVQDGGSLCGLGKNLPPEAWPV